MEAAPRAGRESVYLARQLQCSVMMCRLIESPRIRGDPILLSLRPICSAATGEGKLCVREPKSQRSGTKIPECPADDSTPFWGVPEFLIGCAHPHFISCSQWKSASVWLRKLPMFLCAKAAVSSFYVRNIDTVRAHGCWYQGSLDAVKSSTANRDVSHTWILNVLVIPLGRQKETDNLDFNRKLYFTPNS